MGDGRFELTLDEFHSWCSSRCPRLLDGVSQWIMSLLLLTTPTQLEGVGHREESGATVQTSTTQSKVQTAL